MSRPRASNDQDTPLNVEEPLIAAEMVGAKAGLGYLINYTQMNFLIPQMYAGIVTISVIGLLVNAALVRLERRASRWREDQR